VSLAPAQIARLLQASGAVLRAEVQALPDPLLVFHPEPGEWCAKEVVGHLIEAERRGFAGRIRILLRESQPKLEAWDQNEVARARHDCEREVQSLLDEFTALREASVSLVASLKPEDFGRVGMHPKVGRLSIGDVAHEWVHHDRNHLAQIMANVQTHVWPSMGAAQGFSGE
jgi:DinB superfamily